MHAVCQSALLQITYLAAKSYRYKDKGMERLFLQSARGNEACCTALFTVEYAFEASRRDKNEGNAKRAPAQDDSFAGSVK